MSLQSHGSSLDATWRVVAMIGVSWALSLNLAHCDQTEAPTSLINPAAPGAYEELPPAPTVLAPGLSLPELESLALNGNPALMRAMAEVGAARGNWVQVGLKPNPSVGYEGQQVGSGGLAEQHGVSFGQEIVTGGKLRLNRAVASGEIDVAEQEVAALRLRVLTDVRLAYYRVLVAQRQIELADELIRVSDEGARVAGALFKAQQVGRVDVLQAKLESEQAQLQKVASLNRLDAAWRDLSAVVGNPAIPRATLIGDPASAPRQLQYDEVLSTLLTQSPEIASAAANLQRARAAVERARVQPIPNLSVLGLVNIQDNGIGGRPDGAIGLSVPLPIFNRNQGNLLRAEREVGAAQQTVSQVELDLQQRLAPVFERYLNAQQQVLRYSETILPTAEESLKLTRQMYEAGETDYTGLLTAQRTFAYSHRDYLEAVLSLRLAEVELEGLLLRGSLSTQSSFSPGFAGQ